MTTGAASLFGNIRNFTESEFNIGTTHFKVHKLAPKTGFKVLEMIRTAVGPGLSSLPVEGGTMSIITNVVFSIPEDAVERISNAMYERVEFSPAGSTGGAMPLLASLEMATEAFEPFEFYELLARCLAVNFTGSWDAILSRIQAPAPNSTQPSTET